MMKLLEKYYNINYAAVFPLLEAAKPFVLAKPLEMGQPLHKMVSFDW